MQADVEKLMARLLTDRAARERFVADRAAVAKEAGLSEEETEAMLRIPVQDLLVAGRSYDQKRISKHRRGWNSSLLYFLRAGRG
jgi:hypothetical protein